MIGDDGIAYIDAETFDDLGEALDELPDDCRRVVLCGPRPGGTNATQRAWLDQLGPRWVLADDPYIGPSAMRMKVGEVDTGRTVSITRAAGWFGDSYGPIAVSEATKHVRHVVGRAGAKMVGSPSTTGLAMLRSYWERNGWSFDPSPADVQTLIRSTSGQGRFELFDRGRDRGGRGLVSFDARFQYAAIAASAELGVGEPVDIGAHDPEPYAAAWCEVDFQPGDDDRPFGLLPVKRDRGGWWYPSGGRHRTWCHWCEVELARQHGYLVDVRRAIVWPRRARALRGWATNLIRERAKLDGRTTVDAATRGAVGAAYRNIAIQTIGMLHGRDTRREYWVADSSEIPDDAQGWTPEHGGWRYTVTEPAAHRAGFGFPEWTSHLWAIGRVRLLRQMLDVPPAELVAVALDSMYVTPRGVPIVGDDGGAGRWRVTGTAGQWKPFATMRDVYDHMADDFHG